MTIHAHYRSRVDRSIKYGQPLSDPSDAERETAALTAAQRLQATGTDGEIWTYDEVSLRHACARIEETCLRLRTDEETLMGEGDGGRKPKSLVLQGVEDGCGGMRKVEESSGGWDRTSDTRLMKPLL